MIYYIHMKCSRTFQDCGSRCQNLGKLLEVLHLRMTRTAAVDRWVFMGALRCALHPITVQLQLESVFPKTFCNFLLTNCWLGWFLIRSSRSRKIMIDLIPSNSFHKRSVLSDLSKRPINCKLFRYSIIMGKISQKYYHLLSSLGFIRQIHLYESTLGHKYFDLVNLFLHKVMVRVMDRTRKLLPRQQVSAFESDSLVDIWPSDGCIHLCYYVNDDAVNSNSTNFTVALEIRLFISTPKHSRSTLRCYTTYCCLIIIIRGVGINNSNLRWLSNGLTRRWRERHGNIRPLISNCRSVKMSNHSGGRSELVTFFITVCFQLVKVHITLMGIKITSIS